MKISEEFETRFSEIEYQLDKLKDMVILADDVSDFLVDIQIDERTPQDIREKAHKLNTRC